MRSMRSSSTGEIFESSSGVREVRLIPPRSMARAVLSREDGQEFRVPETGTCMYQCPVLGGTGCVAGNTRNQGGRSTHGPAIEL